MTPEIEAYCNGAAMAYRDVASKIRDMIAKCPPELRPFMQALGPFADVCEHKAVGVFTEAEQFASAVRQ